MAAAARRITMGIPFTNHKLPPIHSELEPRSRSKAEKKSTACTYQRLTCRYMILGENLHVYKGTRDIPVLTVCYTITTFNEPKKRPFEN